MPASTPVILAPLAEADVRGIVQWYEQAQEELGRAFLLALDETITRISQRPKYFPLVLNDVRRASTRRFPYQLHYRLMPTYVHVIAVTHAARNPQAWQDRA